MIIKCIIVSLVLILCKTCTAQFIVEGTVFDQNKEKVDYFHALLCNVNDTSLIEGGTFIDGSFKLVTPKKIKCLLKISYMGLEPVFEIIDFNLKPQFTFDSIILNTQINNLSEVSIRASRPRFSSHNGNIQLNVKSTALSEAGDATDVLKRAPGVLVDNENKISIFGRGSPLIYIDERVITSLSDLQMLQSNDIAHIEIIKNPSSEYSASANALIKITTKKVKSDILNGEIYNRSYFARKFSNNSGIKLNSRKANLSGFINYQYQKVRSENYFKDFDNNYQPDYAINNNTNRTNNDLQNNHYLLGGTNLEIDSNIYFNLQYRYYSQKNDLDSYAHQVIHKSAGASDIFRTIQDNSVSSNKTQHLTALYNQSFAMGNYYVLMADFSEIKHSTYTDMWETASAMATHSGIDNRSINHILAVNGDIDYKIPQILGIKAGIKLSNTRSRGSVDYFGSAINRNTESDQINDFIGAWYCLLSKSVKEVNLQAGLRNENTKTHISEKNIVVLDSVYSNFFPSLNINYSVNDNLEITFNYSRKIKRPSFSQINPNYIYIDSLAYKTGNLLLNPVFSHNSQLSLSLFNSLFISAEYSFRQNEIAFAAFSDENNPDILKYTYINIDKSKHIIMDISYNYSRGKYSCYSSTGIDIPNLAIPYMGSCREIRKPIWYISLNNDLSLLENCSFYVNGLFQSSGEDQMTYYTSSGNLSAGFWIKFFHQKLTLAFDINDMLNTSDISWTDRFGTIENGQYPDHDSRYVKVTIRYCFNNFKNVFKSKTGISEETNRVL